MRGWVIWAAVAGSLAAGGIARADATVCSDPVAHRLPPRREFKLIDRKALTLAADDSGPLARPSFAFGDDGNTPAKTTTDPSLVLDDGGFVFHLGHHYECGFLIIAAYCKTRD